MNHLPLLVHMFPDMVILRGSSTGLISLLVMSESLANQPSKINKLNKLNKVTKLSTTTFMCPTVEAI